MSDERTGPGLPPRPDPETGEPFPPHGLGWTGKDRAPEQDRNRELRLSHKPSPPEGRGPVLAWHKSNKRGKVAVFAASMAILIVGMTFIQMIDGDGNPFSWMLVWQPWVVYVVGALLITRPATYRVLSAGADWAQLHTITFGVTRRRQVIDLYELHTVSGDVVAGGAGLSLTLESGSGENAGHIRLVQHEWQGDRRLWDLVYNGILHSVAAGASVNPNARGMLELALVPELRYPDGPRKIYVSQLSDVHVWEILEDPNISHLCDVIDFKGSAAEFRKLFPELGEEMFTGRVNPAWFTTPDGHDTTGDRRER
ncbi:hypothetical protein BJF85_06100 [Saccharomonospora sp. CUA-673]|uniref:hypothetical protein n=1 Tax=Saccharomonospora sp. CUA-673 TaxID=1904969 RepID=UPI00095AB266|nr:hypothetical protein [Saccharomonospora sp. CUA-673]OLT40689.1 hypothetical protein BJF85_06100 [Saccharomonospora sp. CUA-673]